MAMLPTGNLTPKTAKSKPTRGEMMDHAPLFCDAAAERFRELRKIPSNCGGSGNLLVTGLT
jgi:hypothetical protein